jgi:dihydroorotate dehydrogenase (fumarate)
LVSSRVPNIELAATTGIHSGETVIKVLLAGARVAQICSALYIRGSSIIPQILKEMKTFMEKWNFESVESFRGRLSAKNIPDPMKYERSQFMKYYSNR